MAVALSIMVEACGGGGSASTEAGVPDNRVGAPGAVERGSASTEAGMPDNLDVNGDKPKLTADQAIYEQLALFGGAFTLTLNAPYGGGKMVSGTNYAYATTSANLSQSPLLGPQNEFVKIDSLSDSLSVPGSATDPVRYLKSGGFVDRAPTAPSRVSYVDQGIRVDYLSIDGTTTLESNAYSAFTQVPLVGLLKDSPVELQAQYPLYKWVNGNNMLPEAQWTAGSAYVKRTATVIGDTYYASDCNTDATVIPNASKSGEPNKCFDGPLTQSSFPITQWSMLGHASERYSWSQGIMATIQGLPMWIANKPFPLNKQRYRTFFQLNNLVYAGYVVKDGTKQQRSQSDGSRVDYSLLLNQAALQSIKASLVIQASAGSKMGRPDTVAASKDLFDIGGTAVNGALSAADLRAHYQVPSDLTGAGQTIAIVAYPGDGVNVLDDLNVFSKANELPLMAQCDAKMTNAPCLNISNSTKPANLDSKTQSVWNTEIALDTQMVHALAPNANIVLLLLTDLSSVSAINDSLAGLPISAVSMSYGSTPNAEYTTTYARNSTALLAGIQTGLIYFSSTGDGGAKESLAPNFAISPYVTAVGGTRVTSVKSLAGDQAWQFSGGGYAGTKAFHPDMPDWQSRALSAEQRKAAGNKRAVPDVAAVADFQNSAVAVYCKQAWLMEGGTSASAPVWAGISALLGEYFSKHGRSLKDFVKSYPDGFNEALYTASAAQGGKPGLIDVSVGSNTTLTPSDCPTCLAGVGYDFVTGLGSPSVADLAALLIGLPVPVSQ